MNLHRIYKQYRHCFHNSSNFLTVQSHSALKKGIKIPLTRSVSIVKLSRFKKYTQMILFELYLQILDIRKRRIKLLLVWTTTA